VRAVEIQAEAAVWSALALVVIRADPSPAIPELRTTIAADAKEMPLSNRYEVPPVERRIHSIAHELAATAKRHGGDSSRSRRVC
jgi:hypothetical protein